MFMKMKDTSIAILLGRGEEAVGAHSKGQHSYPKRKSGMGCGKNDTDNFSKTLPRW